MVVCISGHVCLRQNGGLHVEQQYNHTPHTALALFVTILYWVALWPVTVHKPQGYHAFLNIAMHALPGVFVLVLTLCFFKSVIAMQALWTCLHGCVGGFVHQ